MPRKKKPEDQLRVKLNITIHPEIRDWANVISQRRRRSISQIFEELVETEWHRWQIPPQSIPHQAPTPAMQQQPNFYPPQPYYIAQQQRQPQQ